MTNQEARDYFVKLNLSYDKITQGDLYILMGLLDNSFKMANKNKEITDNIRMSKKVKSKFNGNGKLKEAYFYVNSDYFTRRECISFNSDGFIGFAGWASTDNTAPIINAFIKWCDIINLNKIGDDNNEQ